MVLMRRHGATVAGSSLRELTFRTVFGCDNAKLQSAAIAHGYLTQLSPGEIARSQARSLQPAPIERAWDYWVRHLERAGLMPKPAGRTRSGGGGGGGARKSRRRAR